MMRLKKAKSSEWATELDSIHYLHSRIGVAHVEVHEADHKCPHKDSPCRLADLAQVVVPVRRCDELAWLLRLDTIVSSARHPNGVLRLCTYHCTLWLDVLEHCQIICFLDLQARL